MGQAIVNKCPVCRKPVVTEFRPFCSKRCADVDLGRWFGERYVVPTEEQPDETSLPPDGSEID